MLIRSCDINDASSICDIYNHYIQNTTITFETSPLPVADMQRRIDAYTQRYPWLVCVVEDQIVGYAYANTWRERAAYRHTVETSIYVRHGCQGHGYGKALYKALLAALQTMDCHVVLGCIALPNAESVRLHEQLGFEKVAHFREVGRKFDQWLDVGYWQRLCSAP